MYANRIDTACDRIHQIHLAPIHRVHTRLIPFGMTKIPGTTGLSIRLDYPATERIQKIEWETQKFMRRGRNNLTIKDCITKSEQQIVKVVQTKYPVMMYSIEILNSSAILQVKSIEIKSIFVEEMEKYNIYDSTLWHPNTIEWYCENESSMLIDLCFRSNVRDHWKCLWRKISTSNKWKRNNLE